jgi:hypothetical protein
MDFESTGNTETIQEQTSTLSITTLLPATTQSNFLLTAELNSDNIQNTDLPSKQLDVVNSQSKKTQIESTSDTECNDRHKSYTTQSTNETNTTTNANTTNITTTTTTTTTTNTTSTSVITQPVIISTPNTINTTITQSESSKQLDSGHSQLSNTHIENDTSDQSTLIPQIIDIIETFNAQLPRPLSTWQYTSCQELVLQKLDLSFTEFSDASNQIPPILRKFDSIPKGNTKEKKIVAQKLLSIIGSVISVFVGYIYEADLQSEDGLVAHESNYCYLSPYFQSFFDIIFQKKIIAIIQESLLAPAFQFHLFSPLKIQTTVMLMKHYTTEISVPNSIKETLIILHMYASLLFICTPPSHELQPLHLYYTQNLRSSFEYIESESYIRVKQVTKSESQVSV